MMTNYVGCVICSAKWVEKPNSVPSGCLYCGSSSYVLQANLSAEVEALLREQVRQGVSSTEESDNDTEGAFHWF
jgi:predicted  nucleic acid-binding Zn-ribbon protein